MGRDDGDWPQICTDAKLEEDIENVLSMPSYFETLEKKNHNLNKELIKTKDENQKLKEEIAFFKTQLSKHALIGKDVCNAFLHLKNKHKDDMTSTAAQFPLAHKLLGFMANNKRKQPPPQAEEKPRKKRKI